MLSLRNLIKRHGYKVVVNENKKVYIYVKDEKHTIYRNYVDNFLTSSEFISFYSYYDFKLEDVIKFNGRDYLIYSIQRKKYKNKLIYNNIIAFEDDFTKVIELAKFKYRSGSNTVELEYVEELKNKQFKVRLNVFKANPDILNIKHLLYKDYKDITHEITFNYKDVEYLQEYLNEETGEIEEKHLTIGIGFIILWKDRQFEIVKALIHKEYYKYVRFYCYEVNTGIKTNVIEREEGDEIIESIPEAEDDPC